MRQDTELQLAYRPHHIKKLFLPDTSAYTSECFCALCQRPRITYATQAILKEFKRFGIN